MNFWSKLFGFKNAKPIVKEDNQHSKSAPQKSGPPISPTGASVSAPPESPFQKAMAVYRSSQPRYDPDSIDFPSFNKPKLRSAYDMFCEQAGATPHDIEVLLIKAQCIDDLYDSTLLESALADLATVLELDPNDPRAYHLRGTLLCRQLGGTDKETANAQAVENFKKVLELDPQYASDMGTRIATRTTTNRHFRNNLQGHEDTLADLRRSQ